MQPPIITRPLGVQVQSNCVNDPVTAEFGIVFVMQLRIYHSIIVVSLPQILAASYDDGRIYTFFLLLK